MPNNLQNINKYDQSQVYLIFGRLQTISEWHAVFIEQDCMLLINKGFQYKYLLLPLFLWIKLATDDNQKILSQVSTEISSQEDCLRKIAGHHGPKCTILFII